MRENVRRAWRLLCAAYPTFAKEQAAEQIAQTLHLYERLLSDIPAVALDAATLQHIATSKFFPSVAELRETALSLTRPRMSSAIEEWGCVQRAIAQCGRYRSPRFDNPITAKVVELIGWITLCDGVNEAADRARFMQSYEAFCKREREEAALLPEVRKLLVQSSNQHDTRGAF